MPCRWKKQGFSSGEDCISKMTGKVDDPQAFCYGPAEGLLPPNFLKVYKARARERCRVNEVNAQEFDACIDANLDKPDPVEYCANKFGIPIIHTGFEKESYRHPDFDKIYKQFLTHIKGEEEANSRYNGWIQALNLDETRSYANSMREQFKWVRRHVDFKVWKEDSRAKYWMVDAAYPVESMNENIYTLDELRESTRTAKGKTANLNHKFPLPTVSIEAAKYEDGVAECVVRVPKNLMCPICDTSKTINELIEEKGIVNVSLEAVCTLESDDPRKCEGMEFTGLALLTKATLPGIPLTRLMPLEHIMLEALQPSRTRKIQLKEKKTMPKRQKIKLVVKEEDEPHDTTGDHTCPDGQVWDEGEDRCVPLPETAEQVTEPNCPEGQHFEPSTGECEDEDFGEPTAESAGPEMPAVEPTTDIGQLDKLATAVLPDEYGNCPEGYVKAKDGQLCVETETCPENQHFSQDLQKCVPDNVPEPTGPVTAVGTAPTESATTPVTKFGRTEPDTVTHDTEPDVDVHLRPMPEPEIEEPTDKDTTGLHYGLEQPESPPSAPVGAGEPPLKATTEPGAELGEPKEPHATCPDGHHYDYTADMCVPDTPITERVRRMKAEDKVAKAKDKIYGQKVQMERLNARWENRYTEMATKFEQLLGGARQQGKRIKDLNGSLEKTRREREDFRVELRQLKGDFADKVRDNKHLEQMNGDLQIENAGLKKKYHGALQTNLELSRKNTQANEDYLSIAKERDDLREKLGRARNLAKKTVKLKL